MPVVVTESYFWSQVKAGLTNAETDLCRIENTAGTGIPDVSCCMGGKTVWLELKVFHGKRLHFRNAQRSWTVRRTSVGGRVLVLSRGDDALFLHDAAEVYKVEYKPGSDGKSFSVHTDHLPKPLFTCTKPFKWELVKQAIFG